MFYLPRWDRLLTLDLWKNNFPEHEYIPGECFDPTVMERIKEFLISTKVCFANFDIGFHQMFLFLSIFQKNFSYFSNNRSD